MVDTSSPQVAVAATANAPMKPRVTLGVRQLLPLLIGVAMVLLLAQKLAEFDLAQVHAALAQISPLAWAASLALTVISFRAVAQYDVIAHRIFGTGFTRGRALASGASATALAQMLGLGLVTGSLVRWRLLRGGPKDAESAESPGRAMAVTGLVSGGFMFGWAITTLIAFAVLPTLGADIAWIGWTAVPIACALIAASLFTPHFKAFGRSITLPGLPTLAALVVWAAIDTIAAAGALYVLLPSNVGISFALLVPAFLLALGCGIMSGTPGGFGAFELTLLTMTPADAAPEVLAAVVGFRLTYYVLPAMLATGYLLWPADRALAPFDDATTATSAPSKHAIHNAADPLAALLLQDNRAALTSTCGQGHWQIHQGNQALVAIGAPFGARPEAMADTLEEAGRQAGVPAVIYKAPQDVAKALTARGWWQLALGSEAILSPTTFDIAGPTHRQLRRKLRHAEKAGVSVARVDALPLREMTEVALRWSDAHGGERGLSMGRFCADLMRHQHVYVARQDGCVIAFVSFHITRDTWMLDLVRHNDTVPDGTMHTLIHAAILEAAEASVARLSLDCVPFHVPQASGVTGRALNWAFQKAPGALGLLQFKNSFAPAWVPRSLLVRGPTGLFLGGFEIMSALQPQPMTSNPSHNYHADYAVDA